MTVVGLTKRKLDKLVYEGYRSGKLTSQDVTNIEVAHSFAVIGHFNQPRETDEPFIEHPERSAIIALESGFVHTEVIITLLLHDLPEDAPFRIDLNRMPRLRQVVSRNIENALPRLSRFRWTDADPPEREKKTHQEYYEEMEDIELVWVAKSCDRLDNLNTCERWIPKRMIAYLEETQTYIIDKALRHAPLVGKRLQKRVEEIRLAIEQGAPPPRKTPSARSYVPQSMIEGHPELGSKR